MMPGVPQTGVDCRVATAGINLRNRGIGRRWCGNAYIANGWDVAHAADAEPFRSRVMRPQRSFNPIIIIIINPTGSYGIAKDARCTKQLVSARARTPTSWRARQPAGRNRRCADGPQRRQNAAGDQRPHAGRHRSADGVEHPEGKNAEERKAPACRRLSKADPVYIRWDKVRRRRTADIAKLTTEYDRLTRRFAAVGYATRLTAAAMEMLVADGAEHGAGTSVSTWTARRQVCGADRPYQQRFQRPHDGARCRRRRAVSTVDAVSTFVSACMARSSNHERSARHQRPGKRV